MRRTMVRMAAAAAIAAAAAPGAPLAQGAAVELRADAAAAGTSAATRYRGPIHGWRPWPGYPPGWAWGYGAGFPWWGYGAVLPGYVPPAPRARTETIYVNPVPMPRYGTGPAPAAGRWFCPASGRYYPEVNACAQPWMEVSDPDPLPPPASAPPDSAPRPAQTPSAPLPLRP